MWHLAACKNSVSLTFLNWIKNEKIFIVTLNKCWLSGAPFYDYVIIYQFIKPFLDNKVSVFEEYGAFKPAGKATIWDGLAYTSIHSVHTVYRIILDAQADPGLRCSHMHPGAYKYRARC